MDIKKSLKDVLVLFVICCVFGTLLAAVNSVTSQVIKDRENAPVDDSELVKYLPGGSNFKELTIDDKYPSAVKKGWKCDAGCVFRVQVKGYKEGLVIMVGIDSEGKIVTVKHIETNETYGAEPGLDKDYTAKGDTLDTLTQLPSASASGAPMTTKAYYDALNAALLAAKVAGGEEVETRTPEEIFQDNCNEALGTTKLVYTRWFATEVIEGVDKVYVPSDNSGYVFIIGDKFIGVKSTGITTSGVSDADKAIVNAGYTAIAASTRTEITEFPKGVNKNIVQKAYVTASGNYIFELTGSGFADFMAEYDPEYADKPICITISISADGKIIDCITTKHGESTGYGEYCATEEYRDGWLGVTSDKVNESGIIAGSTYTTTGYQFAVKAAFKAFSLLTAEGGE